MTNLSPQCNKPSIVEIGRPVLEKIFEGFFLPCDPDAVKILSCPLPIKALIGGAVSEKMFEL